MAKSAVGATELIRIHSTSWPTITWHPARREGSPPPPSAPPTHTPSTTSSSPWCARNDVARIAIRAACSTASRPICTRRRASAANNSRRTRCITTSGSSASSSVESEVANAKPQLHRDSPAHGCGAEPRRDRAPRIAAPTERDKLIIRLLADTGIRVGELCSLGPTSAVNTSGDRSSRFSPAREQARPHGTAAGSTA